ncbi:MAG: hypothetical protein WCJ37_02010 [Syntrophus sp. (in: bacteria)]
MENMEHTEDVSQFPPLAEAALPKPASPAPRTALIYLSICLVVSLAAGAASGWWFAKANTVEIYVVDVKSIVEGKKKELLENYKKNPNDETIAAADKDLSIFLVQLDQGLIRLGNGGSRLVLLKDIYLGGAAATDATEALANTLKRGPAPQKSYD